MSEQDQPATVPAPELGQLLPGLTQRLPELGRIRMGEKNERGLPVKLRTFRLTSGSRALLEAAARLYGGAVREWKDAPDEGMFELTTEASELDIRIPATFAVIGQAYELWQGGACERRCDGTTEAIGGTACRCEAEAAAAVADMPAHDAALERQRLLGVDRPCDIVTRLRVILPRVPGLGVWRLDTSGYMAATTLPSTVQLLARVTPGAWIEATLRAEQRSKRERVAGKVQTHRFVVPVIDLPGMTIGQALGAGAEADTPLLEEGDTPARPTAADRVRAQRERLEAQQAGASDEGTLAEATSPPVPRADASEPAPCSSTSPKGEACELAAGHNGDHKNGRKAWPDGLSKREPVPAGDGEARQEEAAGGKGAPLAADLTVQAREVFAEDLEVVEGEAREVPADQPAPEVQAGLDLIPPEHRKAGR